MVLSYRIARSWGSRARPGLCTNLKQVSSTPRLRVLPMGLWSNRLLNTKYLKP